MTSPYINTKLFTTIMLHPHQMDNNIYLNLKRNLENKMVGKCFSKYGYIVKIIEVLEYGEGTVEAENTNSAALFNLSFSCKLCSPYKGIKIICQILRITKVLITSVNGPILVISTPNYINNDIFFTDNADAIRYQKNGESTILKTKDFIVVTLQSIKFHDGDQRIKAIGFIDGIASDDDIKQYYVDQYSEAKKIHNNDVEDE